MAIEDDVLVVGGGLAGLSAAIRAARTGARTRLVSHKESTLRQASGLVDVLGYAPRPVGAAAGEATPLSDPFEAFDDLPGEHPYEHVGREGVREGLAFFDDLVGDAYRGGHTDRNALVPTHGGAVKPTARYPASVADGLASDDRAALLVGFDAVTDFSAEYAADHLRAAGVPFDVRGATVSFPGEVRADAALTHLAHALDENELVEHEGSRVGTRTALAELVRPHLGDAERVGFPALLGMDHPEEVRASLSRLLDAAVFEVPMGPPSLPGMRLAARLRDAADAAGVRVTTGVPVVGYDAEGDRIETVAVRHERQRVPYRAEQYVLATGGLVGKGIGSDRSGVSEAVFDCHVPHPADRYDWFEDGAFDAHPFARFGVRTDRDLRPLDATDEPHYENLRAAGAVLGGYDLAAECSGSGVSLATGVRAGTIAGETTT
ncbi:glycerol-3-phosphate dehydrogenase subunit GlpB [Halomarina ordinaria]|uniref:Glycerol-3-phosphate dehydrogenase subunit GlpB n=1 Tax=Halomarina ordinaria TaxID=3033939 RepID=A0ABD5U9C4_9EURY|nr:glycerol-3-phosphate dehydrogenase subunit GlpB [Halomarina sp. PSRA2]